MFSHRVVRALGVATLLGVAMPAGAHAYCRLSTGMPEPGPIGQCQLVGLPLYWARRCLSYSIVQRARETPPFEDPDQLDVRDVIERSFETWQAVSCEDGPLPVSLRQTEELGRCDQPEHNREGRNANTIAFIEDWADRGLPSAAYGITLVWHDDATGEILDADMQLNESSGRFDFCTGRCSGDGVDLQNVVTHEAGHFLGLGHSDEINACMYGDSARGEIRKRLLSRDDIAGVCSIYAGESQPSCAEADYLPRGGWGPDCYHGLEGGGCRCALAGARSRSGSPGWLWVLLPGALWVRRRAERRAGRRRPTAP